ncbi:hypothetical protein [Curtobacterium sp. MCSS17_016]|uniref:hypothetical protein n=1 Tax=Curtobacterium sp. MCSS17_016 TaxID=2175644 RepID=UPI000DA6FE3E|nr:hypothetical protein [Curtobacterium sp. MCSS17_016]WIE81437.1 hypothetical protein DEJ19_019570 [Curtobacterium sp. MCSS17_016]
MTTTFADRASAGGFNTTRDDRKASERVLAQQLERRRLHGDFDHLADYEPSNTIMMVAALLDAFNAVSDTQYRDDPEMLPAEIIPLVGSDPFTASALLDFDGDAVEFFVVLNQDAERPHLWWGPSATSEYTTATVETCDELQSIVEAEFMRGMQRRTIAQHLGLFMPA